MRSLVVFIFTLLLLLNIVSAVSAQTTSAVASFDPSSINTAVGQDFTIKVRVRPSEDVSLRMYQINVGFDQTKLKLKNFTYLIGTRSDNLGGDSVEQITQINNRDPGRIRMIAEILDPVGTRILGGQNTDIVQLTFEVLIAAPTNITVESSSFITKIRTDLFFEEIPLSAVTLGVNGGGGPVTPTPTPTPTPAPGRPVITGFSGLPAPTPPAQCISGSPAGAAINVTWSGRSFQGFFWVDISTRPFSEVASSGDFFHKRVDSTTEVTSASLAGFSHFTRPGESLQFEPGREYFVRVFNGSAEEDGTIISGVHSSVRSFRIPAACPSPTPTPVPQGTVEFRIAETERDLQSVSFRPYSTHPLFFDYTFANTSPGVKTLLVQFKSADGRLSAASRATIDLVADDPVVSSCSIRIDGTSAVFSLAGTNFGSARGTITVNGVDTISLTQNTQTQIRQWTNTSASSALTNAPSGQNFFITLKRADTAESQQIACSAISGLALGTSLFCPQVQRVIQREVDLSVVETSAGAKVQTQKVTIDVKGVVQGLTIRLEEGKPYKISIRPPKGLRRVALVQSASSGMTNIEGIRIPLGDLFPRDLGDGKINAFDRTELIRQWALTTDVVRSGDLNQDGRVNSVDWACMREDFGKEDEDVPTGSPLPTPATTVITSPTGSPTLSPTPTPSPATSVTPTPTPGGGVVSLRYRLAFSPDFPSGATLTGNFGTSEEVILDLDLPAGPPGQRTVYVQFSNDGISWTPTPPTIAQVVLL